MLTPSEMLHVGAPTAHVVAHEERLRAKRFERLWTYRRKPPHFERRTGSRVL